MATDEDVYVEALVRDADGVTHRVRRELLCDFGSGSECESRLLLDGHEVLDLDAIGIVLADPPMRARVLIQHTLRHMLSTEPKQRVGYFKALLALNDLDYLRERVKAIRLRIRVSSRAQPWP